MDRNQVRFGGFASVYLFFMEILSNTSILQQELGTYKESSIFLAEKIIQNYIWKNIKKDDWDDGLSIATTQVVSRMATNNGIKSETVDSHSVVFYDIKSTEDFLWASLVALLDWYKDNPSTQWINTSFSLI